MENAHFEPVAEDEAFRVLKKVSPFKFLTDAEIRDVITRCHLKNFDGGSDLLVSGSKSEAGVFVILRGNVNFSDTQRRIARDAGTLGPGSMFGERECVLEHPYRLNAKAGWPRVACLCVPREVFQSLIDASKSFSFGLHLIMMHNQYVFGNLRTMGRLIDSSVIAGRMSFTDLFRTYLSTAPALHPLIGSSKIDLDALMYSVHRLPDNLTTQHIFLLSRYKPRHMVNPNEFCKSIGSKARRRTCWDFGNGKTFVLLRDPFSDVTDFVTCLCCYATEAKKIRINLEDDAFVRKLQEYIVSRRGAETAEAPEDQRRILRGMLHPDVISGLQAVWPQRLLQRLSDIIFHHETYKLAVDASLSVSTTQTHPPTMWQAALGDALDKFIGPEWHNCTVSFISSNTHSVINLLSPWVHRNKARIREWGAAHCPESAEERADFRQEEDRLYYILKMFLSAHPGDAAARKKEEEDHGIYTLDIDELTGIGVNLIHVPKLDFRHVDPYIKRPVGLDKRLIINIDYCFGRQAEELVSNAVLLFGDKIESINVLGKAGALIGQRGEILIPTHFLVDQTEELKAIAIDLDAAKMARVANTNVHIGPVLTVPGTLMQNADILNYYRRIWHVVGLEMEGSYYARAVSQAIMRGLLSKDVRNRYVYYVSDTPLLKSGNLTKGLAPWEGIPPLYAVTRIIVEAVLTPRRPDEKIAPARTALVMATEYPNIPDTTEAASLSHTVETPAGVRYDAGSGDDVVGMAFPDVAKAEAGADDGAEEAVPM